MIYTITIDICFIFIIIHHLLQATYLVIIVFRGNCPENEILFQDNFLAICYSVLLTSDLWLIVRTVGEVPGLFNCQNKPRGAGGRRGAGPPPPSVVSLPGRSRSQLPSTVWIDESEAEVALYPRPVKVFSGTNDL